MTTLSPSAFLEPVGLASRCTRGAESGRRCASDSGLRQHDGLQGTRVVLGDSEGLLGFGQRESMADHVGDVHGAGRYQLQCQWIGVRVAEDAANRQFTSLDDRYFN